MPHKNYAATQGFSLQVNGWADIAWADMVGWTNMDGWLNGCGWKA